MTMMSRTRSFNSFLLAGACLATIASAAAQETVDPNAPDEEARQQTIVVRGQFIPDEKRSTSEVSALINEEDFALQGDSDAASALARVAGIATADNQFIYVRGLNERYSSALLNGSPLPSPAPLRRVAPLDLFPTSALDSVLVQKTFSPNLPGEFGGGLVDLRTKAIPDERFLTMSIDGGFNTETTLQDGLLYDGGDLDYLGFDDGTRDRPSIENGLTQEFGRQLTDDSSLLVMQEGEISPNFSLGMTAGDRFDFNEYLSMGLLGAVGYSNSWQTREGERGLASRGSNGLTRFFNQDLRSTENTIKLNGLLTAGFDILDNHEVKLTGLVSRSTDKEARIVSGLNEEDVFERVDSLEWFERQLWTTQIQGTSYFPELMNLEVEWRGSYSEALRDAPYQLSNTYIANVQTGILEIGSGASANVIQYSRVDDDTTDFGIDFTLPLEFGDAATCTIMCEVELKAGYSYVENDRNATSILYAIDGTGDPALTNERIDYVYSFIFNSGSGRVVEVSGQQFPQLYVATMEVDAGYVGLDMQVTPFIRAAIGGRFEDAIQAVDTREIGASLDGNTVEGVIDEEDFLPAVTITWNPFEDLQVRAGYSETITRPQFRELAPAVFVNTETDANFFGNPYLTNAAIKNYDVRGEYYFSRGQFITVGLFYKDLEDPIEEILDPAETIQTTFINVPSAELYGFEVEYEQILPLNDWFGWSFFEDRDFTVKTNYTWSDSEVKARENPNDSGLDNTQFCLQFPEDCIAVNIGTNLNPERGLTPAGDRIEDGRRLQGQSEHLFNLQLGISDVDAGAEYNLLLNYVSERIRSGEVIGRQLPAIVEEPPMTLDFVYNKQFQAWGGDYEFSLNIENILGEGYEAYQEADGDRINVDVYDLGTVLSLGLKRKF
jgi:outer membrane receptor protein involved in Fe transport